MIKEFHYNQGDCHIFEGFYESLLWSSDSESNWNYNECSEARNPDRYVDHEVADWKGYTNKVCEEITEEIAGLIVDNEMITRCEYESLWSPREYNFTTDKLNLILDIDLDMLKGELIGNAEYRREFDRYLNRKYTSCSGFISFVENNVDGYFKESVDEYPDVMVDYWILTKIYDTSDVVSAIEKGNLEHFHYRSIEIADDAIWEYMRPISEEDWIREQLIRPMIDKDSELESWLRERYQIPSNWWVGAAAEKIAGHPEEIEAFKTRTGMDYWYEDALKDSEPKSWNE